MADVNFLRSAWQLWLATQVRFNWLLFHKANVLLRTLPDDTIIAILPWCEVWYDRDFSRKKI